MTISLSTLLVAFGVSVFLDLSNYPGGSDPVGHVIGSFEPPVPSSGSRLP